MTLAIALCLFALQPSNETLTMTIDGRPDYAAFDRVLKDVVRDGRVDYLALRENHRDALHGAVGRLAAVDVGSLSRDEQLAYDLNLYNANVLLAVADRCKRGYSASEEDFRLFKEPLVRMREGKVSLNHLEHEIIRKQFNDPRIHAALNCAAVSCPPLIARAYRAEDVDQVLEENVRRWVNDSSRNQIDREKKVARLSKIFEWYMDDFGGPEGVKRFVGKYAGVDLSDYRVEFLEYDWTLNDVAR